MSVSENPLFDPPPRRLDRRGFLARFGGVYEHSPWIAERVWRAGLSEAQDSVAGLAQALRDVVDAAGDDQRLALLRAHPDLAGRAAVHGELTEASTGEQASAGIDQCSEEEFEAFQRYNRSYRDKFGFPFVMAVKGSNRTAILDAFEQRLRNDYDSELQRALQEVHKIARLRLQAIAAENATGDAPAPHPS